MPRTHYLLRYQKLRARMLEFGVDRKTIANELGVALNTIDCRFSGRNQWRIDECYKVLDLLDIPKDQISEYFPWNGGLAS